VAYSIKTADINDELINPTQEVTYMDGLDRRLLALLREDARASIASLAKKLGVARGTVQNRLSRLEHDGTVVGYSVRLKPQVEEHRIRALMTIAVEGNRIDVVIAALRGDPAVGALHSTNGRWDIVAELRADSLASFDQVLGRIRQLDGISSTETSLLLSTFKL
jgi:DNA-binding Lrp family transcriptional regulator